MRTGATPPVSRWWRRSAGSSRWVRPGSAPSIPPSGDSTSRPPAHGTPSRCAFPVPLDYGLLQRALRVATGGGRALAGEIRVEQGETRWTFTPRASWRPGEYRLVAAATLEDVAGNRIGRPFEVDAAEVQGSERARGAVVPFRIGRANAAR